MLIVFSDLDGTLLDSRTYECEAAQPALKLLKQKGIPLVLVTSKTFDEVVFWRRRLSINSAFAIENGGAVFAPQANPPFPRDAMRKNAFQMAEFGVRYPDLVHALRIAARESRCEVEGFSDMSIAEVAKACEFSHEIAAMAKVRLFDEPFRLLNGDIDALQYSIESQGLKMTRGGRFLHITGHNDKADAVLFLIEAWRALGAVETVGLGDAPNDLGFLNIVDRAYLLGSESGALRLQVPKAKTVESGPRGWNTAILEVLGRPSL